MTPLHGPTLERCLKICKILGAHSLPGEVDKLEVPGVGFIQVQAAPYDSRRVWAYGLTDEFFFVKKADPSRCVRGDGDHRNVFRFAQVLARRIFAVSRDVERFIHGRSDNKMGFLLDIFPFGSAKAIAEVWRREDGTLHIEAYLHRKDHTQPSPALVQYANMRGKAEAAMRGHV